MKALPLIVAALAVSTEAHAAITAFAFQSSRSSWVGKGESYTITENHTDFFFRLQSVSDRYFSMLIASKNSPFGPDWNPGSGEAYNYWIVQMATPDGVTFTEGLYLDTARHPFQDPGQPGLTFSGNHRGNNRNGGFFKVLEVGFDPDGHINQFAADFTQYGETRPERWTMGQVRFNSTIPIPEPAAPLLFATGALLGLSMRKRTQTPPQPAPTR
jgi:hypothetical protein